MTLAEMFAEMRAAHAEQLARDATVADALAEAGAPQGLADPVAQGRFWFSAWDGYHAPVYRRQRFES